MLDRLSLDGKVVIVTGGGTGLGRAMVMDLARAGADLVLASRRTAPIEETASKVRDLGRKALAIPTDVTDPSEINRMVESSLNEFGKVDVLINNAGMVHQENVVRPIWDITDQEWRIGVETNLSGAFYTAKAVSRHMVEQGKGKVINVSSGFGVRGGRDMYIYGCTKGGLIQLTRVLAISLARYGVTANTIVPGFIPVEASQKGQGSTTHSTDFLPIGHYGKPGDIGPIAVFLASDASNYMNGETITLDGGGLAGGVAPTGHTLLGPIPRS
jgi:NAD(P)-dependent dehydrogenase (short-subunit alcohol dehydrogenase family)